MKKTFIQADQLLEDSFKLAWNIFESGFRPNYIVGVWRGGAPIGIAVQEFLEVLGVSSDHIAIRTSYYSGINKRKDSVHANSTDPMPFNSFKSKITLWTSLNHFDPFTK